MVVNNLKKISRSHKLDLGGYFFIKSQLKFKFIKNWISLLDEDMLKIEKIYPKIFERFQKRRAYFKFFRLRKFKNKNNKKFIFRIDFDKYDLENEFFIYYKKMKISKVIRYLIKYNQFNRRLVNTKRLFKQKQQFKFFLNLKESQLQNIIFKLKKNKFYLLDFYLFLTYRLDMLIYRVFYFPSLLLAQQYIKEFGVYLNDIYTTNYKYIVSIGSKISLSKSKNSLSYIFYLLSQKFQILPFNFLEINYNLLTIIVRNLFFFNLTLKYNKLFKLKRNKFNLKKLKRNFYFKSVRLLKKNKSELKNKSPLLSNYSTMNVFKQNFNFFEFYLKKLKFFTRSFSFLPIYFPFKLSLKEISYIFHLY